jgi:branched-chain amino acid transport system permease protein
MTSGSTLITVLSGLSVAATLFLVAAGLTLVFGAMRVINVAHGSFYMYGAYISVAIISTSLPHNWAFVAAVVAAPLAVGALGVVTEVGVMRRIYEREHLTQLLATYAIFFILADVGLQIWGTDFRSIAPPSMLAGHVHLLEKTFPIYSLFLIGAAVAVAFFLWLILEHTRLGWQVRAMVEDSELAMATGVDVRRMSTAVFAFAAGLAAFGGALVAPQTSVAPGLDQSVLVEAFIVAVIGGLGSIAGAACGAVIIGIFQAFGTLLIPSWSSVVVYVGMIAVLIIRPIGIFGTDER